MLPFGLIEQALKLVNTLLESTAPEQREAQLRIYWELSWPFWKMFLKTEQIAEIERIMKKNG